MTWALALATYLRLACLIALRDSSSTTSWTSDASLCAPLSSTTFSVPVAILLGTTGALDASDRALRLSMFNLYAFPIIPINIHAQAIRHFVSKLRTDKDLLGRHLYCLSSCRPRCRWLFYDASRPRCMAVFANSSLQLTGAVHRRAHIGAFGGAKPLEARILESRNPLNTCRKHRNVEPPSKMRVYRSQDTCQLAMVWGGGLSVCRKMAQCRGQKMMCSRYEALLLISSLDLLGAA